MIIATLPFSSAINYILLFNLLNRKYEKINAVTPETSFATITGAINVASKAIVKARWPAKVNPDKVTV